MPAGTSESGGGLLTLLRSGLVGVAATVADMGSLALLVEWVGWRATWANVPALGLGVVIQFFGNQRFAFRDRSGGTLRKGGLFLLVEAGAFVLGAGAFHVLVTAASLPYLAARAAGSGAVYLGWSYPFWRLIFRPAAAAEGGL